MSLLSGREKTNLLVLTNSIRNVIDTNGSFDRYSDVLIQNKNRYPPLATIETFDYLNDLFDKNGTITYENIEERINADLKLYSYTPIPIPDSCLNAKPQITGEVVDISGKEVPTENTLSSLCSSLETLSSYYSSSQEYLIALEKYTIDMASFVKKRIEHRRSLQRPKGDRIWERKKDVTNVVDIEPILPSIVPEHPIPPNVPSIPCCDQKFTDMYIDTDDFDVGIQRCADSLGRKNRGGNIENSEREGKNSKRRIENSEGERKNSKSKR